MKNKYRKPKKIVIIDGIKYVAIRERNFIPPKEEPAERADDDYVLPKHTSLFVKTLEGVIEENLDFYLSKLELNCKLHRDKASEKLLQGDYDQAKSFMEKSKDIERLMKASTTAMKITLMNLLLVNFDKLTMQIVSRLD
jgi:hypothetical protein